MSFFLFVQEPVSGGEWYGPEGGIIQVPYINTSTQIQGKEYENDMNIITKTSLTQ